MVQSYLEGLCDDGVMGWWGDDFVVFAELFLLTFFAGNELYRIVQDNMWIKFTSRIELKISQDVGDVNGVDGYGIGKNEWEIKCKKK